MHRYFDEYFAMNPLEEDLRQRTVTYAEQAGGLTLDVLRQFRAWYWRSIPQLSFPEIAAAAGVSEDEVKRVVAIYINDVLQHWLAAHPADVRRKNIPTFPV